MSSSQGKSDSHLRLVSDEDAVVIPNDARPTDDSPTVISKAPPIVPGSSQNKIVDLNRKQPDAIMMMSGLRGRRLAHYELIEPIGVGGMAAVIRARDTQLDRFVALKILPPDMAAEPENVLRFHQEAKAAAKLDHENIARVFYCGEDQGLHFIAFEFVEGKNLRTMLEERGRLPVAETVRYILQVAAGLEHAVSRGVVHRDVKPSNIIVTPTGRAKLVDMGLARNLERKGEHDLTQPGVTLGTFDYISPEQALEPRDADARSDIYSLGCTFYHLLTGQPPVPEGTPAKKLQYHQTMAPIDPRSIDPSIPDEIVMILSRMMEKNPKNRYQRPIDLVHHLMQVAQHVGAANDMPEGVLLVDAPLPTHAPSRPLLYIGLALAALVAITMLISFLPDTPRNFNPGAPWFSTDNGPKKGDGGITSPVGDKLVVAPRPEFVTTGADLKSVLDDRTPATVKATIRETIDLGNTGLVIRAGADQQVIIEPDPELEWVIIRFHYKRDASAFGLDLAGGKEIVFRRIHFQIDYDSTPDRTVGMLCASGARNVRFDRCIFSQPNVPRSAGAKNVPLASVVVEPSEDVRPNVLFDTCFFEGNLLGDGQMAIAVNGPAQVQASNCAFRPHGAFFHLRDKCTNDQTFVTLQNCEGFVTNGPVFRFNKQASAVIRAEKNAFFNPDRVVVTDVGRPQPGLIFLSGVAEFKYEGSQNVYRNLGLYIERRDKRAEDPQPLVDDREKFQKFLANHRGADIGSEEAAVDPLQHPSPLAYKDDRAFHLKAEYRQRDIGLQRTWLGAMPAIPNTAVVVKTPTPQPKVKKIVDPDDESGAPGVYTTLKQALALAKDGDTIYIRHGENSRDVIVSPAEFEIGRNITLKPDTDYQPRLVLNKKYRDIETFVFKVRDGMHVFEGLEIVLDPGQNADVSQSVLQMGQAHCIFRGCVFTLRAANREQLNVVSSIDLDRMMKSETPIAMNAKVEFHDCFVRGKGDLVGLNGCRLLNVEVRNSLVALDGSLLDIEPGAKSMPMTQGVRWKMDRSSIFTTESVFALRSKLGKVLTETQADVEGCLLASIAPEQQVVTFDRERDVDVATLLKWRGEKNFYANFDKIRDWKEQFPEAESNYGRLSLGKLTESNMKSLWDATPDWFRPADAAEEKSMQGVGQPADAEKRMMQPIIEPEEL